MPLDQAAFFHLLLSFSSFSLLFTAGRCSTCGSAHWGWLFEFLLPRSQLEADGLLCAHISESLSPRELPLTGPFLTFSVNSDMAVWETPSTSSVSETLWSTCLNARSSCRVIGWSDTCVEERLKRCTSGRVCFIFVFHASLYFTHTEAGSSFIIFIDLRPANTVCDLSSGALSLLSCEHAQSQSVLTGKFDNSIVMRALQFSVLSVQRTEKKRKPGKVGAALWHRPATSYWSLVRIVVCLHTHHTAVCPTEEGKRSYNRAEKSKWSQTGLN